MARTYPKKIKNKPTSFNRRDGVSYGKRIGLSALLYDNLWGVDNCSVYIRENSAKYSTLFRYNLKP